MKPFPNKLDSVSMERVGEKIELKLLFRPVAGDAQGRGEEWNEQEERLAAVLSHGARFVG